jgi:hypothetical protein
MKLKIKLGKKNDLLLKLIVLNHEQKVIKYPTDSQYTFYRIYTNTITNSTTPIDPNICKPQYIVYYDTCLFRLTKKKMFLSPVEYIGIQKDLLFKCSTESFESSLYEINRLNIDDNGKVIEKEFIEEYDNIVNAYDDLLDNVDLNYITLLAKTKGMLNEI